MEKITLEQLAEMMKVSWLTDKTKIHGNMIINRICHEERGYLITVQSESGALMFYSS